MKKIHEVIISLVKDDYSFEEIQELLSISKYDLLHQYYEIINSIDNRYVEHILRDDYYNNIFFREFGKDKILLISDLHLCSKGELLWSMDQAKEFIKENKIKTVINVRDLGDGLINPKNDMKVASKQIDRILDIYDFGDVRQFILGGNHDHKYKKYGFDLVELLEKENKRIKGVGYLQAYFKILGHVISLEHDSKSRNKEILKPDLRIQGHGHEFKTKQGRIQVMKLPAASNELPNKNAIDKAPGFVLIKGNPKGNGNVELDVERYETTNDGPVLTKKKSLYLD